MGKELPWTSHGAYLPASRLTNRVFRETVANKRGTVPTYRRRSARQLAGPMTVTEMMDAYTVPLLRFVPWPHAPTPMVARPRPAAPTYRGKVPEQINFATLIFEILQDIFLNQIKNYFRMYSDSANANGTFSYLKRKCFFGNSVTRCWNEK